MASLSKTSQWQALSAHRDEISAVHMRDLFDREPERFKNFSLELDGLLFDYSKNPVTGQTLSLLVDLARTAGLEGWRERMFAGEAINTTENRAALHPALRNRSGKPFTVAGKDVMSEINRELDNIRAFTVSVRSGIWKGANGQPICDIVNIGIGGSDLGPGMACQALAHYGKAGLDCHFVSNVDGAHLDGVLARLNPQTTLFIIASKTFTTHETMLNANSARDWIVTSLGEDAVEKHFVAVSTNREKVAEFGISASNIFGFWDWVGGRYSIWSAIGLSLATYIGMDKFEDFLAGAEAMDNHFIQAPLERNMPVMLGLIGIWNNNFLGASSLAILPYSQALARFPAYLQQLEMESNGKAVARDGTALDGHCVPTLFGEPGTNGQHAFMQAIHQAERLIPVDFIVVAEAHENVLTPHQHFQHQQVLVANAFAQSEALMRGKTAREVRSELEAQGLCGSELEKLLPHKVFPGNRPSNTILLERLEPRTLGMLIALYEHKTFVQGIIWGINSFDQWGVELGKHLAAEILPELSSDAASHNHNSSTNALIERFKAYHRDNSSHRT